MPFRWISVETEAEIQVRQTTT